MIAQYLILLGLSHASATGKRNGSLSDKKFMDFVDETMSVERTIASSHSLMAEYFPNIPERSWIVTSPISAIDLEDKYGEEKLIFFFYSSLIMQAQRHRLDKTERLHVLNLLNKILVKYSSLDNIRRSLVSLVAEIVVDPDIFSVRSEIAAVKAELNRVVAYKKILSKIIDAFVEQIGTKEMFYHQVSDGLGKLESILARSNSVSLLMIPRIAHNVLEYITLTSHILMISDPAPAMRILDELNRLLGPGMDRTRRDALEEIVGVIDGGVQTLLDEAQNDVNENPSHSFLIANIVTALSSIS
jgi:hypothetical protein